MTLKKQRTIWQGKQMEASDSKHTDKIVPVIKFLTNIDNCHLPVNAFKELAHCVTVCCLATSWRSNNELSKAVHDD